ncbi:hypothetical protein JL720_3323 [Aureococcus anophagefferens]|nr:hypothetical protein JL720_3323 [Aureococcus anophagefferens]
MFLVPGKLGKRTPRLFRLSAEDHAIIITKSEESSLEIARLPLEELMTVTLAQDEVDHELRVELGTRWSTMRLTAVAGGAGDPRAFVEAIAAATAAASCRARRRAAAAARALGHIAASVHLDAESLHYAVVDDAGPGSAAAVSSRFADLARSCAALSGVALRQLEYSVHLARSAEVRLVDALVGERWRGGGTLLKPNFMTSAPRAARQTFRGKGTWQARFFALDEKRRKLHYYRSTKYAVVDYLQNAHSSQRLRTSALIAQSPDVAGDASLENDEYDPEYDPDDSDSGADARGRAARAGGLRRAVDARRHEDLDSKRRVEDLEAEKDEAGARAAQRIEELERENERLVAAAKAAAEAAAAPAAEVEAPAEDAAAPQEQEEAAAPPRQRPGPARSRSPRRASAAS